MNTASTTFAANPKEFRKTGHCPHCGAPIYADAGLTKGKNGDVLTVLPTPYYTCSCRFTTSIPTSYPPSIPLPPPQYPPYPGSGGTSTPWPWPGTTWIVTNTPSVNQCRNVIPSGPAMDWPAGPMQDWLNSL